MKEEDKKEGTTKRVIKRTLPDGTVVRRVVVKKVDGNSSSTPNKTAAKKSENGGSKGDGKSVKKDGGKKGGDKSRLSFAWLMAINCAIIGLLGVVMFIAAHFLLQSGTRHGVRATVPNFQSLTMESAQALAIEGDLHLIVNDSVYAPTRKSGVILDQIPQEGTVVKPGRSIYVTVSSSQQRMVEVPYVAGRSLRQAKNMLEIASLTIKELIYERDIATNYILAQYCDGKEVTESSHTKALAGSGITLKVGVDEANNETVTPSLIGKSLYFAQNALWEVGLNVGEVSDTEEIAPSERQFAYVISQSQPSDSLLRLGAKVDLELTTDRSMVDTVLNRAMKRLIELEKARLREQIIADSLAMTMGDTMEVVEVKERVKRAEKVEFEDLFN